MKLGNNVTVWHMVYIGKDTKIGSNTSIGSLTHIDRFIKIGNNCKIQGGVYIASNSIIGNNVFLGPGCVLLNDRYPPSAPWIGPTLKDGVIVGGNVTILPAITIGKGAVIGAGSVVTKNISPYTVVAGNPAKPILTRKEYDRKQKEWTKAHE